MRVKGLPIGQGELWHDPIQRATTLTLVLLALAPFLGWIFPAFGVISPGQYQAWVETPLLGVLVGALLFASLRRKALATRVGVGIVVGLVGALIYDLALYLVRIAVPGMDFPLPLGLPIDLAGGLAEPWPLHLHHGLGVVAAWGLAYSILTGKATWFYGLVWSVLIWWLLTLMAVLLPSGQVFLATPVFGRFAALFSVHVIFGMVIGAMNQFLQPEPRGQGKIVFLRDYVAKVKHR
jgi:hypothetical protein